MDEFRIRIDPPNESQGDLVVNILINGRPEPLITHSLDIDSFFSAIGLPESVVNFVFCGVAECCGESLPSISTSQFWQWDDFHLDWAEIYMAATQIVEEIERLPENRWTYEQLHPRLPFYREKLKELETLAAGAIR